jgi:excisionase family DNA binding protein
MTKPQKPLLLTVKEVSILLRIHRPKVYDLIREGIVRGFKIGSDWRIQTDSVENLVGPIPLEFFSKKAASAADDDDKMQAA